MFNFWGNQEMALKLILTLRGGGVYSSAVDITHKLMHSNVPRNRQASRLKDKDTSPSLGTSHVPELFRHRTVQDREETFGSRKGLFNIHRLKRDQKGSKWH